MRNRSFLRSKQRGYLYLTTGANGTGKTLFTLFDVRALQLETNRPVFFKGFAAKQPLLDFGWVEHDMRDWQSLPDGAICVWDECQDEIVSQTADKAQDFEKKILSEHRKRGFDFFLIAQHPMNVGAFIRRAVGAPGWHRHFKASSIALNSNELKWAAVNTEAHKPNSGASGTVTSRTHPKEVYEWYQSTVGDTAKRKIPTRVWVAIGAIILAIVCVIAAIWWFSKYVASITGKDKPATPVAATVAGALPSAPKSRDVRDSDKVLTKAEYVASFAPRIEGFAYSAPRYDAMMTAKQAPKPSACVDGIRPATKKRTCECWSQQATRLDVPEYLCRQIAAGGYFDDTLDAPSAVKGGPAASSPAKPAVAETPKAEPQFASLSVPPVLDAPATSSTVSRDADLLAFSRKRQYIK